jgi:hypothetical protein
VARVVAQEDGTPADSLVLVERGQRLHVGRVLGLVMRRFVELTLGFLTATQTSGEPITRESTVDGVHRTVHESVHELNRPGFGGGSLVEFQATRLVRSPASYSASNSVGGLPPQAP